MTSVKQQELIRALEFTDMAIILAEKELIKLKQAMERLAYLEWKLQHFKERRKDIIEEMDIHEKFKTDK